MKDLDTALDLATRVAPWFGVAKVGFELYAGEKILILSGYDKDLKNYQTWLEKNTKAIAEFNEALKLAPSFVEAKRALARVDIPQ